MIYKFPDIKAGRNLEAAAKGFRELAIAKADRDFQQDKVHNGYESATPEWAAYEFRINILRGKQ